MISYSLAAARAEFERDCSNGKMGLIGYNLHNGEFLGEWPTIQILGPRYYRHILHDGPQVFGFERANGQMIIPGAMFTDGGSTPGILHSIQDLDPWHFFPAYLIHDALFHAHRIGKDILTFEESNLCLAEAISTLIELNWAGGTKLDIELIYRAVSSSFGRAAWDKKESDDG